MTDSRYWSGSVQMFATKHPPITPEYNHFWQYYLITDELSSSIYSIQNDSILTHWGLLFLKLSTFHVILFWLMLLFFYYNMQDLFSAKSLLFCVRRAEMQHQRHSDGKSCHVDKPPSVSTAAPLVIPFWELLLFHMLFTIHVFSKCWGSRDTEPCVRRLVVISLWMSVSVNGNNYLGRFDLFISVNCVSTLETKWYGFMFLGW